MHLQKKLLISLIVLIIIPIIMLTSIICILFLNASTHNAQKYLEQTVEIISKDVNYTFSEALRIANIIESESDIQVALRQPVIEDVPKRYAHKIYINSKLNNIQYASVTDQFFGYYVINGTDKKFKSNNLSFLEDDFFMEDWYYQLMRAKAPIWFPTHVDSFVVQTAGNCFITYGYPIVDKASGYIAGMVLIEMTDQVFLDKFSDIDIGEHSYFSIVDQQNNTVISTNNMRENKNRYYDLVFEKKLENGWCLKGYASSFDIMKGSLSYFSLIVTVSLLIIISIAIIISVKISSDVSKPVNKLMHLMEEVENGNLSVKMEKDHRTYEINKLSKSFNKMVIKLSQLLMQVKEEQIALRKSHFAALQAQINPHFLYNTLDTIAWNIRLKEDQSALVGISALTKFYRLSLSKGKEIITLRDELEHIKMYLVIQELRYQDILKYQIRVENDDLLTYIVPKLVIQPIVENAIYHGIKNKDTAGLITIDIHSQHDKLMIDIEDNGCGMDEDKLSELKKILEAKETVRTDHSYGLKNVNERIKVYFGDEYGLMIDSKKDVLTHVTIVLPMFKNL